MASGYEASPNSLTSGDWMAAEGSFRSVAQPGAAFPNSHKSAKGAKFALSKALG